MTVNHYNEVKNIYMNDWLVIFYSCIGHLLHKKGWLYLCIIISFWKILSIHI